MTDITAPSLLDSWLDVELCVPGTTLTQAINNLNEETGRVYSLSRLGEWRSGQREVPRDARAYMLRCAIGHVLHAEGIDTLRMSEEQLDRIADRLL